MVWIRTTGARAASDPRIAAAPFDFIFIDSDHTFEGLQADWEAWRRMHRESLLFTTSSATVNRVASDSRDRALSPTPASPFWKRWDV